MPWKGDALVEKLQSALDAVPDSAEPRAQRASWLEDTAHVLNLLASDAYAGSLDEAPLDLAQPLLAILAAEEGLVGELVTPTIGLVDAALRQIGGTALLDHAAWGEPAKAAASAVPSALLRHAKRGRPRDAFPVLDFALHAIEDLGPAAPRPQLSSLCPSLMALAGAAETLTAVDDGSSGPGAGPAWLVQTHLQRLALGALLAAEPADVHEALGGLLQRADGGEYKQRELAADCLAAILGQNVDNRQLLGEATPTMVFVAMHELAIAAGQSHAWHCWILSALACAAPADGSPPNPQDLGPAAHALGAVATLVESNEVVRASGPAMLAELLTAVERVARSDCTKDLHDLAHAAGVRTFRRLKSFRTGQHEMRED
eukprot:gnl/TRDRNA2_/TRDRNA2_82365_c0_seq2.p1 gnl/TRDRNA2_/TRDRNA2_82365_c0~~gnl/TRDRNA2_/TRDRNA2_82365_c0_seq2.p1  ORF type:complete len:373 (+),score=79.29 gnl/TRDRNA2_/TRDRNA2_82365_c0_seq2:72-1190(+)